MAEISFVKQEHSFGCAVACIAMVLSKTYEEVERDFLNDFDKKGMQFDHTLNYLGDHGVSIVYKAIRNYDQKDFARNEMLRPFAPAHILCVRPAFDSKLTHLVVMTEKGKILCPQETPEKEIKECYEIAQVAGLYRNA